MNNLLDEIKKRIQLWHEQRAERIEAQRQAQLDAEARKAVQVMEFNGELYVSVHGIPLFSGELIAGDMKAFVADGRKVYKDWKEEKLWEKNATMHASTAY